VRAALASVLLALGSTTLLLLFAEAGCRLAGYRGLEMYRADPELGWVLQPSQRTITRTGHLPVRINDDGFRGAPLEHPKTRGTIRIFALGGSSTFGWGVREEQIYHQVLERMLNDSAQAAGLPQRFEIVNAGVIGYNLWQAGHAMRRMVQRYQPDGFLVAYTFNDAWNPVGTLDAEQRQAVEAGVRRKNLLRSSALFNWLIDLRASRLSGKAESGLSDELATAQTADTSANAANLGLYRATLDSMIALADSAELALGFTVLSGRGQKQPWPRQSAMAEAAVAAGIPVLNLIPVFRPGDPDRLYLPHDGVHPSPLGHAVIARLTYVKLCAAVAAAPAQNPIRVYLPGCPSVARHKPTL
jgi:lysophospholipase L1-like esterase